MNTKEINKLQEYVNRSQAKARRLSREAARESELLAEAEAALAQLRVKAMLRKIK